MWLHLSSHKNSIFTTILKFNPFTQVNKMYHKKNLNIGFNKRRTFESGTMEKCFQFFFFFFFYKWSPLGQFTTLGEQSS